MSKKWRKEGKNAHLQQNSSLKGVFGSFLVRFRLKTFLFFFFFAVSIVFLGAQSDDRQSTQIQHTVQTLIEDFTEFTSGGEDFDFNTIYEDLMNLHMQKVNINTADATTLSKIVFLSDANIQNIISYRSQYGDFVSLHELQSIPGLSLEISKSLSLFVTIGNYKPSHNLRLTDLIRTDNNLFFKWKYNIETARGFQSLNGDQPKFVGNKSHLYLRYNHRSQNERYGLIIEKDPGESLVNEYAASGIDYLSFHYQKENVSPWIRQLNLGDFNVSLGQGLLTHNAFSTSKSSFSTSIKKSRQGVSIYNSVAENQAFRGLSLTIAPPDDLWSAQLYSSYVPRDANLVVDSSGTEVFSSLPVSGLHRTIGERQDQDRINELTLGATLSIHMRESVKLGINAIHHDFNKSFESRRQPFQRFRWQGNQLSNVSVDYNVLVSGWNLYGEVATSSSGGLAQLHGLVKSLDRLFDIAVSYRDYSSRYQALYANAFGESSSANNEKGLYVGFEYRPHKKWSIKGFVDHWENEWLRFRVDGPSTGQEYLLRVDYKERRKRHLYLQYRYEIKDENSDADLIVDIPVTRSIHRLRLQANHQLNGSIELRSRVEFSRYQKEENTEMGILTYQDFIYNKLESPLAVSARLAYFNISDFDARIYTFEQDLLLEYFIPSFNGHGMRYYAKAKYELSRNIMFEIRWEQSIFFGVQSIGSNNQLISGSTQSRVKAQLRWRF